MQFILSVKGTLVDLLYISPAGILGIPAVSEKINVWVLEILYHNILRR